jgi:NADH-quinone oxidoreductase subunit J
MDLLHPYLFWVVALTTGLCAVAVVASQNIVRSATWLLFTLAGVSAIFFLLGADFVGAIQLLVYVGGTMVLVVFGVMLTAQGPFINMQTSVAEWAMSVVVGLIFFGVLAVSSMPTAAPKKHDADHGQSDKKEKKGEDHAHSAGEHGHHAEHIFLLPATTDKYAPKKVLGDDTRTSPYADTLGLGFLGIGVGPAHVEYVKEADADGQPTYKRVIVRTHYFLPFLIVSLHLLVVLIGAAYLARAKRRRRVVA